MDIRKGTAVVVARGRKVPKGTVGVVRWIGSGNWGYRVGIAVEGEDKLVYTALSNVDADESPEGKAREIEAAHESALWIAERKVEGAAKKAEAEAKLPEVDLKKGDKVVPSVGEYAGRRCRVIWVGASREGLRVGVVPITRPIFRGGRPEWPNYPAAWVGLDEVSAAA
jgi:hypothetical protein